MKITKLRTELVSLPFEPPVAGGNGIYLNSCDCVLTFLETDGAGPVGPCFACRHRGPSPAQ